MFEKYCAFKYETKNNKTIMLNSGAIYLKYFNILLIQTFVCYLCNAFYSYIPNYSHSKFVCPKHYIFYKYLIKRLYFNY